MGVRWQLSNKVNVLNATVHFNMVKMGTSSWLSQRAVTLDLGVVDSSSMWGTEITPPNLKALKMLISKL